MNILVLGATGMLGNAVFRVLSEGNGLEVFGTVRQREAKHYFIKELASRLIEVEDIECQNELEIRRISLTLLSFSIQFISSSLWKKLVEPNL